METRPPVDHSLDLPPAAIICPHLKDPNVMVVCAWCPGKAEADAWCKARGYRVTHGCCPACTKKMRAELTKAPAAPTIPSPFNCCGDRDFCIAD